MNEQLLESLNNLISNPYTLIFLGLIFPFILLFIRRFYPEDLRRRMEKEEDCTLKLQQKPQMTLARKVLLFGGLVIAVISFIVSHYVFPTIKDLFINLLLVGIMPMVIWVLYVDYKLGKDKNCNDVVVGYKFMKWFGIFSLIVFVILSVIVVINE